jgi:putative PIN family toxin of toxin-antitoxin system
VVLDTNILVAGLRSRKGAAFKVLSLVGRGVFEICLSVPLVLEYEETLLRHLKETSLTESDVRDVIDYLCSAGHRQEIFFLWRPYLRDPRDDLLLEAAVAGNCGAIITYNRRDFAGVENFGLRILTPGEFLEKRGGL